MKAEVASRWPEFRFAYSRPGFLTFKLPERHNLPANFDLQSVFARAYAFSVGKVVGNDIDQLARGVWEIWGDRPVDRIHVWPRDAAEPGDSGFEPGITPEARAAASVLVRACPEGFSLRPEAADPSQAASLGSAVLDCVLVSPGEWWVGYHQAHSPASQWPGGIMPLVLPPDAVSRAWLKTQEALRWSRLPLASGARFAEIGSAPGGSSQALLERGCHVLGIDPAEMDSRVLAHPNFLHLKTRAVQVRRREFRKIRWLTADMNVAPSYTLDVVEGIVTHAEVNIRGMLLTLKLPQWEVAQELSDCLDRIRSWGYNSVTARQLVHNRREVCVAALMHPFRRKPLYRGKQGEPPKSR